MDPMRRTIVVLGYPGVQSLDVVGPFEVFSTASLLLAANHGAAGHQRGYDVTLVAAGGRQVPAASGLAFGAADLPEPGAPIDTVVLPGGHTDTVLADPVTMDWIVATAPHARRVVSVCTGAFLAARAGLLDGCRATTHWAYADQLAAQYPVIDVDREPIFVRSSEQVWTSAGVTAVFQLCPRHQPLPQTCQAMYTFIWP